MYCSRTCSHKGQPTNRSPWAKGKSKETDPRLARISEHVKDLYRRDPTRMSGPKHPHFGKPQSEAARQALQKANRGRPATPAAREALKLGQDYFRGKKAATDPVLAARSAKVAAAQRGKPNPAHSEWAKRYYAEHPEKHPNHICAQKGHETGLERTMREAMSAAGLSFQCQYRIGRYWVDFAFPATRLAIEVDGAWWHDAAKDNRRDAEITAMGWSVVRFSELLVQSDAQACVQRIIQLLSTRSL